MISALTPIEKSNSQKAGKGIPRAALSPLFHSISCIFFYLFPYIKVVPGNYQYGKTGL
jgi:hypothetical protein